MRRREVYIDSWSNISGGARIKSHPCTMQYRELQCHPGKSGGHVFWCLQFCYRMFQIIYRIGDTKKHGRRSSRDDTATSLTIRWRDNSRAGNKILFCLYALLCIHSPLGHSIENLGYWVAACSHTLNPHCPHAFSQFQVLTACDEYRHEWHAYII